MFFFFFNDTATTEIYTLSLHDALPIYTPSGVPSRDHRAVPAGDLRVHEERSEEHTSELQSQSNLVCRLLLEKKKHSSSAISLASRAICIRLARISTLRALAIAVYETI